MITQNDVVEYLKGAKVGELKTLITTLEDELGVTATVPTLSLPPPKEQVIEEKTEFDVVLTGFTGKKVGVIQAIRKLTGLGLRESQAAVNDAPTVIKEGVSKEEAEAFAAAIREADGTVEVR